MSIVAIVIVVILVVMVTLFVGGLVAARRRSVNMAGSYTRHLDEADRALERARAGDKGWDRELLEQAAHNALAAQVPDFEYVALHLVLVDDPPGIEEDRAHFVASGEDGHQRLILARREEGWVLDRLA